MTTDRRPLAEERRPLAEERRPLAEERLADRVMAAIAREPRPTPTRALWSAVRAASVRDAAAALWVAWHLATVRRTSIRPSVRARSLALVLGALLVLGTASIAAGAAAQIVAQHVANGLNAGQPAVEEPGPVEYLQPSEPAGSGRAGEGQNESDQAGSQQGSGPQDFTGPDESDHPDDGQSGATSSDGGGSQQESDGAQGSDRPADDHDGAIESSAPDGPQGSGSSVTDEAGSDEADGGTEGSAGE